MAPARPPRSAKVLLWTAYVLAAGVAAAGAGQLAASAADGNVPVHVVTSVLVMLAAGWAAPALISRLVPPRHGRDAGGLDASH
ncbi:hypothetical protein ACFY2W_35180 [Streptomyces sp. NPDC001262]|uniref:hypothetical protein n=1 Tax=unclassified Streptomyces TaxID=2593676 RepID=UPI00367F54AC